MKWADIPSSNDPSALLVWALMFAIENPSNSTAKNILEMFVVGGEIGGDPGWEISHYINDYGSEIFEVWVDPRVSGLEQSNHYYDATFVRKITGEVLDAFIRANPNKCSELKRLRDQCILQPI